MKVYIAFAHYDDGRIDDVLGVFDTKGAADKCVTDATRGKWWSVGEYEVQSSHGSAVTNERDS